MKYCYERCNKKISKIEDKIFTDAELKRTFIYTYRQAYTRTTEQKDRKNKEYNA